MKKGEIKSWIPATNGTKRILPQESACYHLYSPHFRTSETQIIWHPSILSDLTQPFINLNCTSSAPAVSTAKNKCAITIKINNERLFQHHKTQ